METARVTCRPVGYRPTRAVAGGPRHVHAGHSVCDTVAGPRLRAFGPAERADPAQRRRPFHHRGRVAAHPVRQSLNLTQARGAWDGSAADLGAQVSAEPQLTPGDRTVVPACGHYRPKNTIGAATRRHLDVDGARYARFQPRSPEPGGSGLLRGGAGKARVELRIARDHVLISRGLAGEVPTQDTGSTAWPMSAGPAGATDACAGNGVFLRQVLPNSGSC